MSSPGEGRPSLGGQGAPPPQAYDPRSNGLTRQPTNPLETQSPHNLSPQRNYGPPPRSLTDPDQHQKQQDPAREKPKGRSKICGKCGEGLTGQFVRALGDTYHLECFTCHVGFFYQLLFPLYVQDVLQAVEEHSLHPLRL